MNSIRVVIRHQSNSLAAALNRGPFTVKRNKATLSNEAARQNNLFSNEQKRQRELVGRIEKIEVQYEGPSDSCTFVMNKNISTPFDCAKRKTVVLYRRVYNE